MDFDFHQQYKGYSNIELLKIVKRPTSYEPAAVAIATQILSERQVTPEEMQFVEQYFQDIDSFAKAKKEKVDALKDKVKDFFEPVLHPSEKVEPKKWVNLLLLVIAIQYIWSIFKTVKRLIRFFRCHNCGIDVFFLVDFLILLYVPLIFFLLFKRKRLGWMLLFADSLFSLVTRASQSYAFFRYQSIHHGDTTSFLLPILIQSAVVFFLWREPIADHFGITQETKKKAVLITTAGTVLFILVMYIVFEL